MNTKEKQMKLMIYLFQKKKENIREFARGVMQFITHISDQADIVQSVTKELISMKFLEK